MHPPHLSIHNKYNHTLDFLTKRVGDRIRLETLEVKAGVLNLCDSDLGELRLWVLGKMRRIVELSPADEISFIPGNLKIESLTHNNGNLGVVNDPYSFKTQFNPAVAIVIVVLLSILFFMGVFSIYIRRCIMEDDGPGPSTRVGAVNNDIPEVGPGLERTVIESFPVFSYSLVKGLKSEAKGSECAVCLSDFEGQEMLRLLPKCSHAFHPECIDMWLCSHTTCPLCRTSLLPDPARPSTEVAFVEASTQTPPEQLTIVTDTQGSHSNDEGAPQMGNDSAGHSLIRVRKELEQPTEWYIATAEGLTPGLRKSCSFQLEHPSQGPSSSKVTPRCGSLGNAGCGARSERWGSISVNPASFLRTFSERFVPQSVESKRFNGRGGALS
ncbi:hypothetical protein SUGI_0808190 [Cryptomeria japonica]|uniref:RING-H2 finger protein ATL7 n=1 Tax=Cryptomeria japonica TaxID=3369 RepID=UPI0024146CE0|nr:RING-H2 finger protein ATL7 [Cryptomeria japonica]GLJ39555.1 hypothetical protein SUGI_0808190 [Cryptomeria japonica]